MNPTTKPSYLGHRARLRKRFLTAGAESFLEHEILELLLTYALPRKDTKPLAWALLKNFGSLANVLDASVKELSSVKGMGPSSALFLKIIRASFKKYMLAEVKNKQPLKTPQLVMDYCRTSLADKKEEFLYSHKSSLEILLSSIKKAQISYLSNISNKNEKKINQHYS